ISDNIVATKLSNHCAQDLIVSYSDGPVYLFDIDGPQHVTIDQQKSDMKKIDRVNKKPKRDGQDDHNDDDADERQFETGENVVVESRMMEESRQAFRTDKTESDDRIELEQNHSSAIEHGTDDRSDSLQESSSTRDHQIDSDQIETSSSSSEEPLMSDESEEEQEQDDEEEEEEYLPSFLASLRKSRLRTRQLFKDVPLVAPIQKYTGHINSETVKDVNFLSFGNKDDFVMSGSDDGRWFVWDKIQGELIAIYEGDSNVVNVLQSHPHLPLVAISGIDNTVKLFGPTCSQNHQQNLIKNKDLILNSNDRLQERSRRMSRMSETLTAHDLMRLIMSRMPRDNGEEIEQVDTIPRIRVRRTRQGNDEDETERQAEVNECRIM
ncbi:hypothetical protein OIO90_005202, partial [Microbotryomycetes sp. JL221]